MKIILQADIKGLGKKGEAAEVADGYGRNYLIPRGLAFEASSGALKQAELEKQAKKKKEEKEESQAKELAKSLNGKTITMKVKGGETGRLYGSITSKDVTDLLNSELKLSLDKRKVELDEQIKSVGTYAVTVRLYPGIATNMHLSVVLE